MAASASLHTAFSLVGTRCGESGWRVDDRVGMEQLIEGIKVACITCGQPAEHDRG